MVEIKSKREIELMRESCRLAIETQRKVEEAIIPGISTMELDKIAEDFIKQNNAIPAQKNYPHPDSRINPFPATLCISINDEVIHGIPSKKVILKEGDIVSVDLVVLKNGFNGDCARTYTVGKVSDIGRSMHEDPAIPNYGKAGKGIRLEPGMTLAVEPMVMIGNDNILELDDGWTIVTESGNLAAHYENTILITEKEAEILTN